MSLTLSLPSSNVATSLTGINSNKIGNCSTAACSPQFLGNESVANSTTDRVEWSRATILNFIEDYKMERVLWDLSTKGYHIKQTKLEALKMLANKYGVEVRTIRSKIKSLRSSFHREHGKVSTGMKNGVHYQPMWFAYDAIRFILESGEAISRTFPKEETSVDPDDEVAQNLAILHEEAEDVADANDAVDDDNKNGVANGEGDGSGKDDSNDKRSQAKARAAFQNLVSVSLSNMKKELGKSAAAAGANAATATAVLPPTLPATVMRYDMKPSAAAGYTANGKLFSAAPPTPPRATTPATATATAQSPPPPPPTTTTTAATNSTIHNIMKSPDNNSNSSGTMPMTALQNATFAAMQLGVMPIGASGLLAGGAPHGAGAVAGGGAGSGAGGNGGANSSGTTMSHLFGARATAAARGNTPKEEHETRNNVFTMRGFPAMADEATRSSASAANTNTAATSDYDANMQSYCCNISANDVKTEIIEGDEAGDLVMHEQQQQQQHQQQQQQLQEEEELQHHQQLIHQQHQQQQQLLQQQQQHLLQQHQLQHLPRATSSLSPSPTNYYKPIPIVEILSSSSSNLVGSRKRKAHAYASDAAPLSKQLPHQLQLLQAVSHSSNAQLTAQPNQKRDLVSSSASGNFASGSDHSNNINIGSKNSSNNNNATGTTTSSLSNAVASTSKNSNFITNKDEYGVFGEYVAFTIRELKTSKAKIVVKHLINNLLFEAEMGKYDHGFETSRDPPQLYQM